MIIATETSSGLMPWDLKRFTATQVRKGLWDMRNLIGAVILLAIAVYVRWSDWKDVAIIVLRDPEASHVYLVPEVAAYLVWVRRERLRRVKIGCSWLGPVIVLIGSLACYWGENGGYQSVRHVGALVIAVGALVTMLGRDMLVNFAPAFLVLIFLVPVPPSFRQAVSLPLERLMAQLTEETFNLLGWVVDRSGNRLIVNGTQVDVVEGCNGLRMFFTLVLVSFVVTFSVPLKSWVRMLNLAFSPVVAIAWNVVRLVVTAWAMGHFLPTQESKEAFHEAAGWVMLPLAFASNYAIVWALRWALVPVGPFTLARD